LNILKSSNQICS